jgi:predicted RNase H-like HicB family nuclease
MATTMEMSEILKRPYTRVLTFERDGRVTAEITEFPNCVTWGSGVDEALRRLESVAADWIEAALEQGQEIPEPLSG